MLLGDIACDASCIPLLHKTQDLFAFGEDKGYRISKDVERELLEIEKRVVAGLQLSHLKDGTSATMRLKRAKTTTVCVFTTSRTHPSP